MPRGTPENVTLGPGTLRAAAVSAAEPTDLATAWPVAWATLGYTKEGSTFKYAPTFEAAEVAEELDPIKNSIRSRVITVEFQLAEMTTANLSRAFNGGTVVGPTGGIVTYEPPALGTESRLALGWEAEDGQERWIFRKCLQTGEVSTARQKGAANYATLPTVFTLEAVTGLQPFKVIADDSRA